MLSSLKDKMSFRHATQSQHLQNYSKRSSSKNSTPIKSGKKNSKISRKTPIMNKYSRLSKNPKVENLTKNLKSKENNLISVGNPLKFQQYKKEKLNNLNTKKPKRRTKKLKSYKQNSLNPQNTTKRTYSKSNFLKDKTGYFSSKIEEKQTKSIQLNNISRKSQISYKKEEN